MTAPVFVDTNVFVYAYDPGEPVKRQRARELLASASDVVLSTQVLQEFYAAVVRKLHSVTPETALAAVRALAEHRVIQVDPELIFEAIGSSQTEQLAFWDALILAAAQRARCIELWSEDLQHGRRYGNLTVLNPFRS